MNRREFLAGCTAAAAGAARLASGQPSAPQNLRANKRVLQRADFTYLGYYKTGLSADFSYGMGLALRRVNGEARLLALAYGGPPVVYQLVEFRVPDTIGATISQLTGWWPDMWKGLRGPSNGQWHGIFWDDVSQRLLSTAAVDYPDDTYMMYTKTILSSELGLGGAIPSVRGPWGLSGVGTRAIYGGFVAVPDWFRSQYGGGRLAVGFGGYTSRMAQGLTPGLGPNLFSFPDPFSYADNTEFPAQTTRVLLDSRSGVRSSDWYTGQSAQGPSSFDRGVREFNYTSFYDAGSAFPNTPGHWNLAPGGVGRWTWGDSAWGTGVWIDLPDKHGFVISPTLHTGRVRYGTPSPSTLNYDGRCVEWQIFDPDRLGAVASGAAAPWSVKPASRWVQSYDVDTSATGPGEGNTPAKALVGAVFDPVTRRLYQRYSMAAGQWPYPEDRIFVWQVS